MKKDVAIVAGTFDPLTLGHETLIKRVAELFSKVYVVIGVNCEKNTMFDLKDRFEMLSLVFKEEDNIEPIFYDGLIADVAKEKNAVIVKGLRYSSDFDYEHLQAESNFMINGVETLFLASHSEDTFVTSSLVRELIKAGKPIEKYVPDAVAYRIKSIIRQETI